MARKTRNAPQGVEQRDKWLRGDQAGRTRPWAYEELLFGSARARQRDKQLGALAAELALERDELAQLRAELDARAARISRLERRVRELATRGSRSDAGEQTASRGRVAPPDEWDSSRRPLELTHPLTRCEGFRVDSPSGTVGVVEGIRFVSRIDRPDLLEVRAGRFGRTLLLIPIEEVEEISADEKRVVVGSTPPLHGVHLAELALRLRKALSVGHSES
jgi:hypothetical protein